MKQFSSVAPTFWTRGSGKKLRGNFRAQALALYVMTAPNSTYTGLYYAPAQTIASETGIPLADLAGVFTEIADIAKYDFENDILWVPEAASYQVGDVLKSGDKRRAMVLRDLKLIGKHPFLLEFVSKYGVAYGVSLTDVIGFEDGASEVAGCPHIHIILSSSLDSQITDPEISEPEQPTSLPSPPPVTTTEPTLQEKSAKVLRNPYDGQFSQPSKWPEVVEVAKAWSEPFGIKTLRMRDFTEGDRDLKAIIQAFADGYSVDELLRAGKLAETAEYFKRPGKKGPSTFTAAVIRRLLADEKPKVSEKTIAAQRSRQDALQREIDQKTARARSAIENAKQEQPRSSNASISELVSMVGH